MKKEKPHDSFFKQVFAYRQIAVDYLKNFVAPEIINQLDLRTLQHTPDSFIGDGMESYFSDMIFSIDWKKGVKANNPPKVYLLIEHKSYLPKFIHVQLLKYMVEVWSLDIENKRSLTLILPIVIYHGKKKWKHRSFASYFNLPDEKFLTFIPIFDYVLTDLNKVSDEELMALQAGFLVNAFIAFKHSGDEKYLKENAVKVFVNALKYLETEWGENLIKKLNVYLVKTTKLETPEVIKIIESLPEPLKEITMTTYDKFIKLGEDRGIGIGIDIGIGQGFELAIKVAEFIKEFPDLTDEEIAKKFEIELAVVKKVRASLIS